MTVGVARLSFTVVFYLGRRAKLVAGAWCTGVFEIKVPLSLFKPESFRGVLKQLSLSVGVILAIESYFFMGVFNYWLGYVRVKGEARSLVFYDY